MFYFLSALLFIFMPTININLSDNGETVNDLFELYNKKTINGLTEIKNEYIKAKEEYEFLCKDVISAEAFNLMYESAQAYQNDKKEKIDETIKNLMLENDNIISEIESNIDGDFDKLVRLDCKYKTNADNVNNLLKEKSKYSLTEKQEIDYLKLGELEKEISTLETEYKESADVSTLGEVTNVKYPLGKDTIITSYYGERIDPMTKNTIRFHAGIDLRASINTEVLALFNGIVSGTGYGTLGGYYIRIDHGNGVSSYYCHLNEIRCSKGQYVDQYEVIALSGNTGIRTTGPHLHLGLYIDGNSVDPGVLFSKGD